MLFNSYPFIFVFLPVALLGYQLAGKFGRRAVVGWLALASLIFYGRWYPPFVIILLSSIALNYAAAWFISHASETPSRSKLFLWLAIALNLGALCYFKYLVPSLNFLAKLSSSHHRWVDVALPLGISFFTFTQIAYLVDLQQGIAEFQDPLSYLLFVTFFPHLIAGPILHHKEMVPQWSEDRVYQLRANDLAVGFTWFIMGLAKKALLADRLAVTANLGFGPDITHLWALTSIRVMLSYVLQLYFDFSGYSDMALGLARMFSIDFPLNFSSPFKSRNIIDFWQRWHITLSRYITSYLYSPIQFAVSRWRIEKGKKVSRKAQATVEGFTSMVAMPMIVTMFIAGIWHGAGLQFLAYGVLHGLYLTVAHAWRTFRHAKGIHTPVSRGAQVLAQVSSILLTFICVIVADTFFRANSLHDALRMLGSVLHVHTPQQWRIHIPGESHSEFLTNVVMIPLGLLIVWTMPNTQQILSRFKPSLEPTTWDIEGTPRRFFWTPTWSWALALSICFVAVLVSLQVRSAFLYFQF